MKQAAEFSAFLVIAAVAHLALFQDTPRGGAPSAGDAGQDSITLALSTQALSTMVAEWDRPVDAVQRIAIPEPATLHSQQVPVSTQPEVVLAPARPEIAGSAPDFDRLPSIDTTVPPPSTLAVTASPRPQDRPLQPRQTRSTQPPPPQTALGSGQNRASGSKGTATAPTRQQTPNPTLMAQWGSSIRAAVERRKRYPAGGRKRGTATLSIAVSSAGALASVNVRRSSGDAVLDQAALRAVRKARFPTAPKGLPSGVHLFSLPISFNP